MLPITSFHRLTKEAINNNALLFIHFVHPEHLLLLCTSTNHRDTSTRFYRHLPLRSLLLLNTTFYLLFHTPILHSFAALSSNDSVLPNRLHFSNSVKPFRTSYTSPALPTISLFSANSSPSSAAKARKAGLWHFLLHRRRCCLHQLLHCSPLALLLVTPQHATTIDPNSGLPPFYTASKRAPRYLENRDVFDETYNNS